MAWERTWRLETRRIDIGKVREAAQAVAAAYQGVDVSVEEEDPGIVTCFFDVPWDEEGDDVGTVEVSLYEVDGSVVISLEGEASDNDGLWDDAGQLAEDLADSLGAVDLDLDG